MINVNIFNHGLAIKCSTVENITNNNQNIPLGKKNTKNKTSFSNLNYKFDDQIGDILHAFSYHINFNNIYPNIKSNIHESVKLVLDNTKNQIQEIISKIMEAIKDLRNINKVKNIQSTYDKIEQLKTIIQTLDDIINENLESSVEMEKLKKIDEMIQQTTMYKKILKQQEYQNTQKTKKQIQKNHQIETQKQQEKNQIETQNQQENHQTETQNQQENHQTETQNQQENHQTETQKQQEKNQIEAQNQQEKNQIETQNQQENHQIEYIYSKMKNQMYVNINQMYATIDQIYVNIHQMYSTINQLYININQIQTTINSNLSTSDKIIKLTNLTNYKLHNVKQLCKKRKNIANIKMPIQNNKKQIIINQNTQIQNQLNNQAQNNILNSQTIETHHKINMQNNQILNN